MDTALEDKYANILSADLSDKLQIVNSKGETRNKVHEFPHDSDILDIISHFLATNSSDDPFYIVDLYEVYKKYRDWITLLPRVHPFYAIKSNPDPVMLNVLAKLGAGADAASKSEIILAKSAGIPDDKIIYANPCKNIESLKYARSEDVDYLTFDCKNELDKIKVFHSNAKCVIRIKVDDSGSLCKFSSKFGCTLEEARELLELAKLDELNVVGVSYHTGSNCRVLGQFDKAFQDTKKVFDMAKEYGFNFTLVDIGGGMPGTDDYEVTFPMLAEEINNAIDKYFSDIDGLKLIAEPGRYLSCASHTLVVTVIGIKTRKNNETNEQEYIYTIDDAVYGSFNCIVFDHAVPEILPYNERTEKTYKSYINGITCDSMDIITKTPIDLPILVYGDKLYVRNFGSYTRASSSSFNGFKTSTMHYITRV
jgi:ornithine decarboxylase